MPPLLAQVPQDVTSRAVDPAITARRIRRYWSDRHGCNPRPGVTERTAGTTPGLKAYDRLRVARPCRRGGNWQIGACSVRYITFGSNNHRTTAGDLSGPADGTTQMTCSHLS